MQTRGLMRIVFALVMITTVPLAAVAGTDDWSNSLLDNPDRSTCRIHLATQHSAELLDREFREFQTLAEEALGLRAVTIKVGRELKQKVDADRPLTGADLDLLGFGLSAHLDLRKKLLGIAEMHECWINLDEEDLGRHGLTPELRLEGVMLSLASALVMYDNYLYTASLFEADPKLRFLLNEGDQGYQVSKAELMRVTASYHSISNRARVRRVMRFYEGELDAGEGETANSYLATLIEQSPSYDRVRSWSPISVIAKKLGVLGNLTVDSIKDLERDGVSLFSMMFGNTVGLVETREGKLYHRAEISAELQQELQTGDILLEKTPFRLTDKLIPGYWGHAAVWIGTEEELRELGIWNDPLVKKYHAEIRDKRLVVEALRSGVEMNSLDHFLNIDSIGVLRRPQLSADKRARIVLNALRQVGKPYDFNFDVESLDSVYCSKLVYLAYHGVDWPVQESFGRKTISPDDVAVRVFNRDDLELITFYHDGRPVEDQPITTMAKLMGVDPGVYEGQESQGRELE